MSERQYLTKLLFPAVIAIAVCSQSTVLAAPFALGNILVSVDDTIHEYTITGDLVQSIPVPHPDTTRYDAADVVYDRYGNIHVVNYAPFSNDYISTYNPTTDSWQHTPAPVSFGNGSDGDLSILGDKVFRRGVRMDATTLTVETFNIGMFNGPSETSVGRDLLLYSISSGSPRYRVQRTDPLSLANVGPEFELRDASGSRLNGRGLAVTEDETLFVADWDGRIYVFDSQGTFISDFATGIRSLNELNLRSDGMLLAANRFGEVVLTDTAFSFARTFDAGSGQGYATFVTIPVPEPVAESIALILLVISAFANHRHRITKA